MQKDDLNVHLFQNTNLGSFHRKEFKWKRKYGSTGKVSEKTEALYAELNERVEAATSSSSATGEFLQYIYSVLVDKNRQMISSRCLVHKFSIKDIVFNFVLYGCGFLLILCKSGQNDAHCNCIVPFLFFFSCRAE